MSGLRTLLPLGLALALGAGAGASEIRGLGDRIEGSLRRGIDYLLESQNPNGSWGAPTRTKGLNIYAPVPGAHHAFRAGTTGLAAAALIELRDFEGREKKIRAAIDRVEDWFFEHLPRLRRATPTALYNVWGHAYSIQALTRLAALHEEEGHADRARLCEELIRGQIERLVRYELVNGGWGYYDFDYGTQKPAGSPTCFTTATVLIALGEARDRGIEVPGRIVKRARASILRQQKSDHSYIYGEYLQWRPMRLVNRHGGSLGRTQVCNVALRAWGDERITDEVHATCLRRLLDRNLWLDIGRKRPIPHESWFQVAGYFFYYGHYYAALAIEQLAEDRRAPLARGLAGVLLEIQEKDGSWWDYPLYSYHQPYGTGFALMALSRCRE